ncbi:MAG: sigma-54-dependent Fis family transcriptional regulator [Candidatus Glassbacteria bacterium]|nr:sigma-54-dependent Fis family transcriptional regulator [Candidatus Glassbacteria bacterium]
MKKSENYRILVVDDEFSVRDSLYNWFREDGYEVETAENAQEALKKFQEKSFDIALLDIKMPGIDGIELQKRINSIAGDTIIIIITAFASVRTAVQALKEGAFDYITKPFDPDELSHLIKNACNQRKLKAANIQLKEQLQELAGFEDIIGESPAMQQVFELVDTVSKTDSNVMIRGDSGTGKELVAKAIHRKSNRMYFPIITVNCGAVAEGLMESELFGHEKGAFTGAHYKRKGKFEMADGGTIFFDEIGNISMKMQMELLRVIETKQITRVGGNDTLHVDFRLICATNQNLEKELQNGNFRDDIYYRLNVFTVKLPSLRERRSDIPLLVTHFIKKYSDVMNKDISGIESQALDTLVKYNWPGNVRELENAIERAIVVVKGNLITLSDLSFQFDSFSEKSASESLADLEKKHIAEILKSTGWNISQSANILKIDRGTLYNKIKKYKLTDKN